MALIGALLGQLRPKLAGAVSGRKGRHVILHGQSGRAYAFEVHSAAGAIDDVPAVYVYARSRPEGGRDEGDALDVGFIGRTEAMAQRAEEHERLGHFIGHGFDTLLISRVEPELIRDGIADDMIARHRPVLNELLGGYRDAAVS